MQNKFLPVLVVAALLTPAAHAQEATSSTGAPAQVAQPTYAAPGQANIAQPAPMTQVAPTPNEVIYSPRLPSVAELTNVAAAQGLSIEQINQTATQITVVHKNASGQLTTVAYQLLPTAAPQVATQQTVVVPAPAPTVIYQSAPRTVIYESYDPFPPSYYYPPVSLNFGFGYYRGWGGHHHHWHGR